jgi:DNA-binding MarR family transcriptional regulator
MPEHDQVDMILAQWARERPDLDPSPMGVIGRISRAERYIDQALLQIFSKYKLGRGEFDVLATLRRAGPPFRLTPTALYSALMLSSGAMTNRIDRLERAGLVERLPDPTDRRGTLVGLTSSGQKVIDHAIGAHLANETRLLSGLTGEERAVLAALLRKLLLSLGDRLSAEE